MLPFALGAIVGAAVVVVLAIRRSARALTRRR
jgi:hypothetical protein